MQNALATRFVAGFATGFAALPRNVRGALWMLLAAATFTASMTLIKLLGAHYSAAVQTFYRNAVAMLILAPLILRDPRGAFATNRPGFMVFRALAGTTALILSFYAVQEMPLAEANALSFTRTLWVVPLAALVLGERIGPHRLGAVVLGFVGVLVMLLPAMTGVRWGWPALAALAGALLFAATIVMMKIMTRDHSTRAILAWTTLLSIGLSLPFAAASWTWPTPGDLALLGLMGALSTATQACFIKGMSEGDAVLMTPIDYVRLVFAAIIGFTVFGETPTLAAVVGAAIVIASTLYITLREARLGRKTPAADSV